MGPEGVRLSEYSRITETTIFSTAYSSIQFKRQYLHVHNTFYIGNAVCSVMVSGKSLKCFFDNSTTVECHSTVVLFFLQPLVNNTQ